MKTKPCCLPSKQVFKFLKSKYIASFYELNSFISRKTDFFQKDSASIAYTTAEVGILSISSALTCNLRDVDPLVCVPDIDFTVCPGLLPESLRGGGTDREIISIFFMNISQSRDYSHGSFHSRLEV